MSLQVPMDKPLTDVVRRYLRGLGAHGQHLEARLDAAFPPDAEALASFEVSERERLSAINGTGMTATDQDLMRDEIERLRAEVAALRASAEAPPASNAPNYAGWTKAQLEAEVDRVNSEDASANLNKGKVAEMVEALSEYFAE